MNMTKEKKTSPTTHNDPLENSLAHKLIEYESQGTTSNLKVTRLSEISLKKMCQTSLEIFTTILIKKCLCTRCP